MVSNLRRLRRSIHIRYGDKWGVQLPHYYNYPTVISITSHNKSGWNLWLSRRGPSPTSISHLSQTTKSRLMRNLRYESNCVRAACLFIPQRVRPNSAAFKTWSRDRNEGTSVATYRMEAPSKNNRATFICIAFQQSFLLTPPPPHPNKMGPTWVLDYGLSSSCWVWWGKQKKCDESKE